MKVRKAVTIRRLLWTAATAGALAVPLQSANATNGYLGICVGANNCGMGGAGVALPQDASSGAINPALMANVPDELFISPAWFSPNRTREVHGALANPAAATSETSRHKNFPEGAAGYNHHLKNGFDVGVAVYGSGGMSTEYANARVNPGFTGNAGDSEVLYRLGNLAPTLAWSNGHSAYGASLVLGYSDFKTNFAVSNPAGPLPMKETAGGLATDTAYGVGFRVGGTWNLTDTLTVGATVASPVWFQSFSKYNDLFLGPINTPANGTIGVAWKVRPDTTIAADFKYIGYAWVRAIGTDPARGGFGWKNEPVFMLGIQHQLNEKWTVRAGYNYGQSPIPDSATFANAMFPAVVEHHATIGASYKFNQAWEASASYMHAFKATQTDPGTGDTYSQSGKGTSVSLEEDAVHVGLTYKF